MNDQCAYKALRSSHPEVFLGKGVQKICSKFTGEHPCRSATWHGCFPVNLLHTVATANNTVTPLFSMSASSQP